MQSNSEEPPQQIPPTPVVLPVDLVECPVCVEEVPGHEFTSVDGSTVCYGCVRDLFQSAIKSEDRYPPSWGELLLRPSQFRDVLAKELRDEFREKEKEYYTPPAERIYCSQKLVVGAQGQRGLSLPASTPIVREITCGTFLGQLIQPTEADVFRRRGRSLEVDCPECECSHCLVCGKESELEEHQCSALQGQQEDDESFRGLVRGKDYQICPSTRCKRKIELWDGCNHIQCICNQSFCFVCGQPARIDHWSRNRAEGGCPRYNHPSMPTAMWMDGGAGMPPPERPRLLPLEAMLVGDGENPRAFFPAPAGRFPMQMEQQRRNAVAEPNALVEDTENDILETLAQLRDLSHGLGATPNDVLQWARQSVTEWEEGNEPVPDDIPEDPQRNDMLEDVGILVRRHDGLTLTLEADRTEAAIEQLRRDVEMSQDREREVIEQVRRRLEMMRGDLQERPTLQAAEHPAAEAGHTVETAGTTAQRELDRLNQRLETNLRRREDLDLAVLAAEAAGRAQRDRERAIRDEELAMRIREHATQEEAIEQVLVDVREDVPRPEQARRNTNNQPRPQLHQTPLVPLIVGPPLQIPPDPPTFREIFEGLRNMRQLPRRQMAEEQPTDPHLQIPSTADGRVLAGQHVDLPVRVGRGRHLPHRPQNALAGPEDAIGGAQREVMNEGVRLPGQNNPFNTADPRRSTASEDDEAAAIRHERRLAARVRQMEEDQAQDDEMANILDHFEETLG